MLRAIDRSNWRAVARLSLPDEQQRFLAPNVWSIAEMQFESHYVARAVLVADEPIGFAMYSTDDDEPDSGLVWIFRFMIAAEHQRKGYGTAALNALTREIREGGATRLRIMHGPKNDVAAALYARLGFEPIGVLDDGDIERELVL